MNPYILDRGQKIVMEENNVKDPHLFTEKLLEFKAEIDELVNYSFTNQMMHVLERVAKMEFKSRCFCLVITGGMYLWNMYLPLQQRKAFSWGKKS